MARIVIIGAGLGGLPAAYDLRKELGKDHEITVVSTADHFQFTPSNPWVAVGWRSGPQVRVPIEKPLARKGIKLVVDAARKIEPEQNRLELASGATL